MVLLDVPYCCVYFITREFEYLFIYVLAICIFFLFELHIHVIFCIMLFGIKYNTSS